MVSQTALCKNHATSYSLQHHNVLPHITEFKGVPLLFLATQSNPSPRWIFLLVKIPFNSLHALPFLFFPLRLSLQTCHMILAYLFLPFAHTQREAAGGSIFTAA